MASLFRPAVVLLAGRPWFRRLAIESPPGRRLAARFVAGETLDEAVEVAWALHRQRIATMLDHLGEHVRGPDQAAAAADAYVAALERIGGEPGLDCTLSVKLTQLGLDLSRESCLAHMERILEVAEGSGTLVMIDMESHEYVDRTLAVHRELRSRHELVGVCLQSYLRRTSVDVFDLPEGSIVRLVKGAYLEPPELVFASRREVDASFRRLFATLLARGHTVHVATHDPRLVHGARLLAERRGVDWKRVEFQMLYGIRRDLQRALAEGGYPVRVYVPYGSEWYPYLTRRLAERPANLWFFVSNLFRPGPGGR